MRKCTNTCRTVLFTIVSQWPSHSDQILVEIIKSTYLFGVYLPHGGHMMAGACARFFVTRRITDNRHMTRHRAHHFSDTASAIADNNHRWTFFISILQKWYIRFRHSLSNALAPEKIFIYFSRREFENKRCSCLHLFTLRLFNLILFLSSFVRMSLNQ